MNLLTTTTTTTVPYTEHAWHVLALLLSTGKPTSPTILSQKCTLFPATSDFITFLCSIPNSPITLSQLSNLVWPSSSAFVAVKEFFSSSVEIGERIESGFGGLVVSSSLNKKKRMRFECDDVVVVKKRAVLDFLKGNEREKPRICPIERVIRTYFQEVNPQTRHIGRTLKAPWFGMSELAVNLSSFLTTNPLSRGFDVRFLENGSKIDGDWVSVNSLSVSLLNHISQCKIKELGDGTDKDDAIVTYPVPDLNEKWSDPIPESFVEPSAMLGIDRADTAATCLEFYQQSRSVLVDDVTAINASMDTRNSRETRIGELAEHEAIRDGPQTFQTHMETTTSRNLCMSELLNKIVDGEPVVNFHPKTFSAMVKDGQRVELAQKQQLSSKLVQHDKVDVINKKHKSPKAPSIDAMKHKPKQSGMRTAIIQDKCDTHHKSSKDQSTSKSFPKFDHYVVEEEEGSGGYGIVYRARRGDGTVVAIKCPHKNAHKQHVKNELRMLERFGGKNFVIKYEGSFKHGSFDCSVLEHVDHDRPEVLKRDINISQLQWYGFCMFKALASLHKQGVCHRDVKPGNFLFSCKNSKGFLIDFNLAKDLHQQHENTGKARTANLTFNIPISQSKPVSPNKRRKLLGSKPSETIKSAAANGANLESKVLKKKNVDRLKTYGELSRRNSVTSQGGEASGVTSAKDITPSAERLREPLPCLGRKELINLAQEAMQSPNRGEASAPVSHRKRVAASPGNIDRKFFYLTPMPLYSSSIPISGTGAQKNRGEVKPHKEGPCAGTKGFRAPEVLLRSLHQGPKIDVWSAGVTLLYLISGKLPFTGEPEQNMKEIAKLRGNEELWEVAKLHNRECSFPVELMDIKYLPSKKIQDWCTANTKRPGFLEQIPASLFDLIEKCLTVNPRLRITAEEALKLEFFAPCHETLQRHRLMKRSLNEDSRSKCLPLMHATRTPKPSKLNDQSIKL